MPAKKKTKVTNQTTDQLLKTLTSMISRADIQSRLGGQFNGNRDLYAVLGYERIPTFAHYLGHYQRGDIAARIIDAKPESTWRRKPVVSNDRDPDNFTEFEIAWALLEKKRRIFHYLERVDKLAGIGEFGILLIGTDDLRNRDDLARPMVKLRHGPDSLIYLTPLHAGSSTIAQYDVDPASERFGLPEIYNVEMAGSTDRAPNLIPERIAEAQKLSIHWTRIIHVAEGLHENDVMGTPRLRPILNRLYDVDKIAGGSAEIFWQAAKRILVLSAKDGFTAVDSDDALTNMMDELIHGLRRTIDLQGYDMKTLDPSEVKPDEAFRVALALISSATGIPQRILLGSEQGKMASTQDEVNWNGRIADRQINFAEPVILRPFIDRLIKVGVLPNPGGEYTVTWPSLFELSDKEKAQIGLLKARAIAQYTGKMGADFETNQLVVPMEEFRGEILNLRSRKIEQATSESGGQSDNPGGSGGTGEVIPARPPKVPASTKPAPNAPNATGTAATATKASIKATNSVLTHAGPIKDLINLAGLNLSDDE